jgi:hypothetical protein
MKNILFLLILAFSTGNAIAQVGKVGVNTTTPKALLHVVDSSVLFSGVSGLVVPNPPGNPPDSGAGIRMMWYPDKAAFRTGRVTDTHWDKDSIGFASFAAGFNTKAKGGGSVALNNSSSALGNTSFATGSLTIASGSVSTAMGSSTIASGEPLLPGCGQLQWDRVHRLQGNFQPQWVTELLHLVAHPQQWDFLQMLQGFIQSQWVTALRRLHRQQ